MKIAHIADVHIKLLSHHETYRNIFDQLYSSLKEEKVDYTIICGDLFHNKTQLSPEAVALAAEFLTRLSNISPVLLIAGNHDGNLKNADRQDAITPIVEAINSPRVKMLKDSGETHLNDDVVLNVLSIFDRDNWVKPSDNNKINIALYHGAISGAKTDLGWSMKDTDDDISIFDDFDFALLGDIHKQQFFNKKRIAYCGSLIQQNFGEDVDKGILIWDIESKDKWNVKPIYFSNPHPYVTVEYGKEFDSTKIPTNSIVRVLLDKYYSQDQIQDIRTEIDQKVGPDKLVIVESKAAQIEDRAEIEGISKLNLRDNNVQQNLIRQFLESDSLDEDTINAVLELNTKYNLSAETEDDGARNVKWSLSSFAWDNLFNYKDGNRIIFDDLQGVVGIFGKNYSGKSSVIDGLLYTLFNTTSKKIKRNFDVVNERKNYGKGEVVITIGEDNLVITRETEKNFKKSKGKIVEEGKTSTNFELISAASNVMPMNGIDRNETDKNIRKEIGSYEDFCNTSLSTQHGSLDFINEGSTRRKEILANFLDLQIFERKHKPANQDANELKALIKKLQLKDYSKLLDDARYKQVNASNKQEDASIEYSKLSEELSQAKLELAKLNDDLSKFQIDINYEKLIKDRNNYNTQIEQLTKSVETKQKEIETNIDYDSKCENAMEMIDIDATKKKQELAQELSATLTNLTSDRKVKTESLSLHKKNSLNLESAACGTSQFNECAFKRSALESLKQIDIVELALGGINEQYANTESEYNKLEPAKNKERIESYNKLKDKRAENKNIQLKLKAQIAECNLQITNYKGLLSVVENSIKLYENNREVYENISSIRQKRDEKKKEIENLEASLVVSEKKKTEAIKELASIETLISSYEENLEELQRLNKEYSAYELFLKCVHNNGIPFELIKKSLSTLNEEMNKMLKNIVEFSAFFQNEDGKLEIYVQHPDNQPRAIENCSGAEKSLVAMAIRLALVKCGSLPVSDVFILDEPATALDAEHLDSFIKVLEMIKSEFKTVLLVTHIDALKDSVDKIIEIQKDDDGYAYIN